MKCLCPHNKTACPVHNRQPYTPKRPETLTYGGQGFIQWLIERLEALDEWLAERAWHAQSKHASEHGMLRVKAERPHPRRLW